jgi:hypothetical protein
VQRLRARPKLSYGRTADSQHAAWLRNRKQPERELNGKDVTFRARLSLMPWEQPPSGATFMTGNAGKTQTTAQLLIFLLPVPE